MAKLNFKYRGKHEPTDVLSFEQKMKHSPKGIFFLGDLVLCSNVVRRQAKVEGHPVKTEVAVLLVHGILHLLGFDHEHSRKKAAQMAAQESKILKQLYQRSATGLISRAWVKVQK